MFISDGLSHCSKYVAIFGVEVSNIISIQECEPFHSINIFLRIVLLLLRSIIIYGKSINNQRQIRWRMPFNEIRRILKYRTQKIRQVERLLFCRFFVNCERRRFCSQSIVGYIFHVS